ncbi:MAG: deoxyribose-phosphate aldolase [Sediminibacterium sp.]|nr:deoxyribose-phosphate aldolase [Sediminibacterium sp.]
MKNLSKYIDHTILKPTLLFSDIDILCQEAIDNQFCAVCIPPNFVSYAKPILVNTSIKLATVIGFPFGYSAIEAKVAETVLALIDGADELDVVANISAIKNGQYDYLKQEVGFLLDLIHKKEKCLKIIIESGILTEFEIIKCCQIYGEAGVDFLKTSTGYAEKGASLEAVSLFKQHLPPTVQIKASGGIKDAAFAQALIDAGAHRLGCSKSVYICKENIC